MYCDVDFGTAYAGLSTVGYTVTDASGDVVIARTTAGVIEIGKGAYGAEIDVAEGFVGTIQWDTAEGSSIVASERIVNRTPSGDADAWLDRADAIEAGITPRQAIRGLVAMLFGQISTAGTLSEAFKNPGGTAIRVTITADGDGDRSSITLNL